jgi:hypothetical protein
MKGIGMRLAVSLAVLLLLGSASVSHAKSHRYAGGPAPGVDTALAVADPSIEPIVRARGPRVPLTNLQLVELVGNTAFERALKAAPLDSGARVLVAPAESHPLNFLIEHALLLELGRRGVVATVRRSIVPDDSLTAATGGTGNPILEYQLGTARVTYLRLVGWLPGRVKIERQGLVQGALTLRDPRGGTVLWSGEASYNLVDAFPRGDLNLVEDPRFSDLKSPPPTRNVDKVFEPVIVVAVVAGLVALFFQNRP